MDICYMKFQKYMIPQHNQTEKLPKTQDTPNHFRYFYFNQSKKMNRQCEHKTKKPNEIHAWINSLTYDDFQRIWPSDTMDWNGCTRPYNHYWTKFQQMGGANFLQYLAPSDKIVLQKYYHTKQK